MVIMVIMVIIVLTLYDEEGNQHYKSIHVLLVLAFIPLVERARFEILKINPWLMLLLWLAIRKR